MEMDVASGDSRPAGHIRAGLAKLGWVVGLCLLLLLVTWVLDRESLRVQAFTYIHSYGFFVNSVPVLLAFIILLGLSNRIVFSVLLTAVLTAAIYVANTLKIRYLHDPVSFSDVYVLQNLHGSTLDLLSNYVGGRFVVLLVAIALLAGAFGAIRRERPFFPKWSSLRLVTCIAAVYAMYGIGTGAGWVGAVYNARDLRIIAWSPMQSILHSGLLSSIAYTSAERTRALDVPADPRAVDALRSLPDPPAAQPLTAGTAPDIVIIQSESFFDTSILRDVDSSDAVLPNLQKALTQGRGGTMKPPTFGGGTLRTEFEVLTGIPMGAYPDIHFPYLQITRESLPSIVRVVRKAGYRTVAVHGNAGDFWNRTKAFKAIGFDEFITAADFPADAAREGWYYADSAMTDQIIGRLEKADKPTMIFAISIEAHGPYLKVPVGDAARRDRIDAPDDLGSDGALEYRNYMYHIENADRQLGRLWDFLRDRKRPFILAFYGDHLPGLQYVYESAGFDDGRTGPEQFVPWFIVGDKSSPATKHIYSWMLGTEVMRAAGIVPSPYYRLISKAEHNMDQHPDEAHTDSTTQGVYSAARLYLKEQLAPYLDRRP
jgi:phosphoglycerol transferase MdoB-like AlkP superfamily enzyme